MMLGQSLVNPSDSFSDTVAVTSVTMAPASKIHDSISCAPC